jgi:hypothetical protein
LPQLQRLPNILGIFDYLPVSRDEKLKLCSESTATIMFYSSERFRLTPDAAWKPEIASYSCGWIYRHAPWLLVTYRGKSDLLSREDEALHDMFVAPSDLLPVLAELGPSIVSSTLCQPELALGPAWIFQPVTEFWLDSGCPPSVVIVVTTDGQHLFRSTDIPLEDCKLRKVFANAAR